MDAPHDPADEALRTALTDSGQGHLVEAWLRLEPSRRGAFRAQLAALDLGRVREMAALLATEPSVPAQEDFDAAEVFPLARTVEQDQKALAARRAGQEALARGEVGWILVAGGQASRLGIDVPKGMFPVGPVTGRTLFEWFARKLLAARGRSRAAIPWYVMTSDANDGATRAYFEENDHFGIDREDVFFFRQGMLPALDPQGRILLSAPDRISWAPDGHGGALAALATSGALADAKRRGITTLSYFQVDNPLARPADPLFIGLHRLERAQMSSKVVAKRHASEKVGVIGRVSGRLACIEYSDLPGRLREARDPAGRLVFSAGNVAMHVLDVDFVERLTRGGLKLPWHLARKQVSALDESGRTAPRTAIKFESFVFDALGMAERSVTLEVRRAEEFSPVKNATGEDSPATARADLCGLFGSWVEAAGLPLPAPGPDGLPAVEVDPVFAEDRASFLEKRPRAPRGSERGHLYA